MNPRPGRLAAFLLLPVLLVGAGCAKLHTSIEIASETDVTLISELVDTQGLLELEESGCADLAAQIPDSEFDEFTDEQGNAGCRIVTPIGHAANSEVFRISKDGDEYEFVVSNLLDHLPGVGEGLNVDDPVLALFSPDVELTVVFPGPVASASEGGIVEANSVTWTGIDILNTRLEARGAVTGTPQQGPTPEETTAPEGDGSPEATTTLPTWAVIVIGLLLLAVIFLIVALARNQRSHRSRNTPEQGAQP